MDDTHMMWRKKICFFSDKMRAKSCVDPASIHGPAFFLDSSLSFGPHATVKAQNTTTLTTI